MCKMPAKLRKRIEKRIVKGEKFAAAHKIIHFPLSIITFFITFAPEIKYKHYDKDIH